MYLDEANFAGDKWLGRLVEVYWDSPAHLRGFYKGTIAKSRILNGDYEYKVVYEKPMKGHFGVVPETPTSKSSWESVDDGFRFVDFMNEKYTTELIATRRIRKLKGVLADIRIKKGTIFDLNFIILIDF